MTKDLKFKVLTYMGEFVSLVKMSSGIYSTNKPYLYPIEETLYSIIESYKKAPYPPSSDTFFKNLSECELTEVTLGFLTSSMNKKKPSSVDFRNYAWDNMGIDTGTPAGLGAYLEWLEGLLDNEVEMQAVIENL